MVRPLIALSIVLLPVAAAQGHCRQFFCHKKVVVQQVAVPLYYHTVSPYLASEAQTRRIIREELQAIQAAPALQQTAAPQPILAAKCSRCHSGPDAKGGHVIDGSAAIDCDTFRRTMEMLSGNGAPPPAGMQAVLAGLKDDDKAAIMDSMLKLPVTGDLQ